MISFTCDYSEGAHPRVLERLAATNLEQTPGYGLDSYCGRAAALIRKSCAREDAAVHFLVGGTQTNLTVLAAALRPHQGALAADTGHINVHESGAIEASGHKVLPIPANDGKITAAQVEEALRAHWESPTREHTVQPGLLYLSQPTELGTVYARAELEAIARVCHNYGVPLYVDGARLGAAITAEGADCGLADLAALCDAFTIGGTKNGLLFGEALIITNPALGRDFRYIMKQRGGMLAKGRLLGVQFLAVWEDGLYFEMARHANEQALRIRRACEARGWEFLVPSPTNQQFPILPDSALAALSGSYAFETWGPVGENRTAVRICTSWATRPEDVDALVSDISLASDIARAAGAAKT